MSEPSGTTGTDQQASSSGIERVWLGWDRPLLRQAAAWLLDRAAREWSASAECQMLRLDHVVCVTPGRRAGRVMTEVLLRVCDGRGVKMLPPRTLTPGSLVDAVVEPAEDASRAVRASRLESELAWISALRKQSRETLGALLTAPLNRTQRLPRNEQHSECDLAAGPDDDDAAGWQALARTIHRLHVELSGMRKSFADVAAAVDSLGREREKQRWDALDRIARDYHAVLAALPEPALIDAERDRERAAAESALHDDVEVVLIGVTELNQVQRTLLNRLHDRTTALVHAPGEHAAGFDALGCVDAAYWSKQVLDIDDEQILVAEKPGDQAQAVMRELARRSDAQPAIGSHPSASDTPERPALTEREGQGSRSSAVAGCEASSSGARSIHPPAPAPRGPGTSAESRKPKAESHFHVDQVTIGVEDASLADQLDLAAQWAGVHVHRAEGETLAATGPYRLLAAVADLLEEPRFAHFAAMLRHPHLEAALRGCTEKNDGSRQSEIPPRRTGGDLNEDEPRASDWLALLDRYFADHLHERLTGEWLGRDEERNRLKSIYDGVAEILRPLLDAKVRLLGNWAEPIMSVLAAVYAGEGTGDRGQGTGPPPRAIDACEVIRDALSEITQTHEQLQPQVCAHEAVRAVLEIVRDEHIPDQLRDDQVESLGWLELHADLAPALILMGVNDGIIPRSVTSDAFLPNGLRSPLGLVDDAHRYARDAYLLQAIRHSRERLLIITGRRSGEGEPLPPSRLLLSCDREMLPARVRMLSDEKFAWRWPIPIGMKAAAAESMFLIPRPPSEPPVVDRMSVTSFALYLSCPYRFWLQRILQLEALEDSAEELDAMRFGTLIHEILQRFGENKKVSDSDDAEAIQQFLLSELERTGTRAFGKSPMPAVRIQLDRVAQRLRTFAHRQAALRAEGWQIIATELKLPENVALKLDDQPPMRITGKIDRIDQHETTRAYRIIDYKSGNNAKSPIEVHHPGKRSRDEWIDLQLPLYRYLAGQIDILGEVEVGYFVLPRDPAECDLLLADWTEEELDDAIDVARDVVQRVRAGEFWPPSDLNMRDDPFENICQTNAFGVDVWDEESGGES